MNPWRERKAGPVGATPSPFYRGKRGSDTNKEASEEQNPTPGPGMALLDALLSQ